MNEGTDQNLQDDNHIADLEQPEGGSLVPPGNEAQHQPEETVGLSLAEKQRAILDKQNRVTISQAQPYFQWTWLFQIALSVFLLTEACWTDARYSVSSLLTFGLFLAHIYCYAVFRGYDGAIDMLAPLRSSTKHQ